jgi:hypothetical protein
VAAVVTGRQAAADARANAIRQGLNDLHGTLTRLMAAAAEAWAERDWETLGYGSWQAYVDGEFGEGRLRLTIDQRQLMVGYLRGEAAMSERGIAVLLGVSQMTVHRDAVIAADSNDSPVKGVDGKTYPARKPTAKAEREVPSAYDEPWLYVLGSCETALTMGKPLAEGEFKTKVIDLLEKALARLRQDDSG